MRLVSNGGGLYSETIGAGHYIESQQIDFLRISSKWFGPHQGKALLYALVQVGDLDIGEITNLHQRIKQCLSLMRAEPFTADSDEINLLGLYIMSRSNGLAIETPAVRY